jgi:hypothetical protein
LKRLFSAVYNLIDFAAGIAQLVRAPDCGSGGRGFETHYPPFPSSLFLIAYKSSTRFLPLSTPQSSLSEIAAAILRAIHHSKSFKESSDKRTLRAFVLLLSWICALVSS